MNIGPHTFREFKPKAADFHGYPAPGLLIGGYMVELARNRMPEGTLFTAMAETPKRLPEAVQPLTHQSVGNGWMKVVNMGRYAFSLYDKSAGLGWRVFLDPAKLALWPGTEAWFMKLTPKRDQDTDRLFDEIERADLPGANNLVIGLNRDLAPVGHELLPAEQKAGRYAVLAGDVRDVHPRLQRLLDQLNLLDHYPPSTLDSGQHLNHRFPVSIRSGHRARPISYGWQGIRSKRGLLHQGRTEVRIRVPAGDAHRRHEARCCIFLGNIVMFRKTRLGNPGGRYG